MWWVENNIYNEISSLLNYLYYSVSSNSNSWLWSDVSSLLVPTPLLLRSWCTAPVMLENGVHGQIFFVCYIKFFCNSHAMCYSYVSQRLRVWSCHAATLESFAWQLHDGSTVIAACWYSLNSHVMASVCVCVCVHTTCLQPGIWEEGGHRGCRWRGTSMTTAMSAVFLKLSVLPPQYIISSVGVLW